MSDAYLNNNGRNIDIKFEKVKQRIEITVASWHELASRFIGELEYGGFNPYMFNEGADKLEIYYVSRKHAIAMGMTDKEFNSRLGK